jgi:3'-phosphoadenosine 5'-phosphosulfate sulfotransferase (PAPS reductase)/FAD synthetase
MTILDKIDDALRIIDEALATHLDGRELVGKVVLFSGGNDSTTLLHLMAMQGVATHAAHANTTIGVEQTRRFVRETAHFFMLPLIEKSGPKSYADLVLEAGGFPGPAMHYKMYQRLKERALREIRKELVTDGRKQRVLYIAGRRRSESDRRAGIPEHERVDSVIWASPFANWTKGDLNEYRAMFPDSLPRNSVADDLGMSGECLCGAFAEPGEFERILAVDPEVAQEIVDIEATLHARHSADRQWGLSVANALRVEANALEDDDASNWTDQPSEVERLRAEAARLEATPEEPPAKCKWGWGAYRADPDGQPPKTGPLCSSCDARFTPTRATEPTPELQKVLDRMAARRLEKGLSA